MKEFLCWWLVATEIVLMTFVIIRASLQEAEALKKGLIRKVDPKCKQEGGCY